MQYICPAQINSYPSDILVLYRIHAGRDNRIVYARGR